MTDQPQDVFDRTPPFSMGAEVSVLGAMMIDKDAVVIAMERITAGMFYREAHRRIFQAMVKLFERGDVVDPVTLGDQLKTTHELEASGGFDYISNIMDAVPTGANVDYHAKIVKEKAQLRRLVEVSSQAIRDVYDQGERSVDEVIGEAETRLLALGAATGREYFHVKERLWLVFEEMEEAQIARAKDPTGVPGIRTGLVDLDRKMLGLHNGELTVIAARPSMGKTALALGILMSATISEGVASIFFSFEMPGKDLIMRMIAADGSVDLQRMRGGHTLSAEEHQRMSAAAGQVSDAPIYIDDSPDVSLSSVAGRIRRAHKQDGIRLAIIDYLQLMSGVGSNRREEIDSITRSLKALARALDIPIVLLSQLSRGPESRTDKRPLLSDLRDSGGIEQDADNVIMLYRPDYYMNPQQLSQLNGQEGLTELLVPKQRNGPTGRVRVQFHKQWTRFESLARPGGPQPD